MAWQLLGTDRDSSYSYLRIYIVTHVGGGGGQLELITGVATIPTVYNFICGFGWQFYILQVNLD